MLLTELPQEVLSQIFSHVPSVQLWRVVRNVCKLLYNMLNDDNYWFRRAQEQYDLRLPHRLKHNSIPALGIKNCYAVDCVVEKWNECNALAKPKIAQVHFATIDAVKICRSQSTNKLLCLTGSRDHSIILWDLDSVKKDDKKTWIVAKKDAAHAGWVWQLDFDGDSTFYSAGWDRHLKQWFLAESYIASGSSLFMDTAVLSCLVDNNHILYCSTYTCGPIQCDTRTNLSVLKTLKCHGSKSIFSMTTSREINYIFSIGEDNRIVSVDKRMFTKPVRVWKAPEKVSKIQYSSGYLGVSYRNGAFILMNPETLESENILWVEPKDLLQETRNNHFSIAISRGANFCAYGHFLKVYSPGLSSKLLATYQLEAAITQMDYFDNTLVAGSGMGTVSFWQ